MLNSKIRKGQLVRIIGTEGRNEFYMVSEYSEDRALITNCHSGSTDDVMEIEKLERVETHLLRTVLEKLEVGDIIVTNCDGSGQCDVFLQGKIGEIDEEKIYLWNNIKSGTQGKKIVVKYKKCWMFKKQSTGKVIIIKKVEHIEGKCRCFNCSEYFEEDKLIEAPDDNKYCKDCMDDIFAECNKCEEVVLRTDAAKDPNGEWLCNECWEEQCVKCYDCGETIWNDDSCYNSDGDTYCDDCYSERYTHCEHCEKEICRGNAAIGADDLSYCNDCWNDRFVSCESCGIAIWQDDATFNEEDDEYYCSACRRGRTGKNIHEYGYRPEPECKKMPWEEELYFGVELEIQHDEAKTKSEDFLDFLESIKVKDRFYLKHDSSINSDEGHGFEIVSHPATLHYYNKQIKMKQIIEWLQKQDFQADTTTNCGLHIHISRAFFTELEITKMRLFFLNNKEQIGKFSNREGDDISDPFHYCQFEKLSEKEILQETGQSDRYWALNLNSSRETIEIRVFRATINYQRFLAIMQFVEAISRFVKKIGIAAFIYGEREYKKNSWKLFIDWAKEENKYQDMIRYFEKEKIKKESSVCV